ncbi:glycosyltransferase involved in cell wall biosynthesis [Chryseobacterium sp. SORGH_AS 447]|uniref:glycosyltransferase family 4 protein n=1 Tax=Chryseobacterium sp. SORGH_AS_0447 TaxID=3041769 RepID=UPI00277DD3FE|nr:glycosyltransferase family 4 protein [Chryseobacterium sp. SORGH_AS_0447]MDQ1161018.1 glycosyltransferase involved in cell wall biosynthesis [Chryseobacterium sp. SORGH_AS_0447]
MNNYDIIILNNCPSFYKINLYNEINKSIKIYVIFLGLSDQVVIDDNFKKNIDFDFKILNEFQVEKRFFLNTFAKLLHIVKNLKCKKIIYGGYIEKEFILLSFLISKNKNIIQSESAIESVVKGWKKWIKRVILTRYYSAIVSGISHRKALKSLGFKGNIMITKGVGILRKKQVDEQILKEEREMKKLKFLYVGRLIEKKNVEFIIRIFNHLNLPLTIVGDGPLLGSLKSISNNNIIFRGHCSNDEIYKIYQEHHVFVLPSTVEPWGLVVEEALYNNCVLLLSENVGSLNEMLIEPGTGEFFNPLDSSSFSSALNNVINNYKELLENVKHYDLNKKDLNQVNTYIQILND